MNKLLVSITRRIVKSYLEDCTKEQRIFFRQIYAPESKDIPLNIIVDNLSERILNIALSQLERTIIENIDNGISGAEQKEDMIIDALLKDEYIREQESRNKHSSVKKI